MHSFIPLSLFFTLFNPSLAVTLPFQVVLPTEQTTSNSRIMRRGPGTMALNNIGNAQYVTNITLGGVPMAVLIDTGSSDLWVNFPGTPPQTTDLGKSLSLSYAIGSASGRISSAQLKFNQFTIDNQAFLQVNDASTFSTDIQAQGYSGLMGLGPNSGSQVLDKIGKNHNADSVLSRVFQQSKASSNYITFLLDRKGSNQAYTGQFTISEVLPQFSNITSAPKLNVEEVLKLLDSDQHWQALTDKDNGIIGPDGQVIKIKSIVPRAPSGQLVAVMDSGFTFSQVPRDVADAIYGRVQGAVYDSQKEWWTVPCGQMLQISFNFGGVNYPINPLDTVDDNFNYRDAKGNRMCIGAFQPITTAFSLLGHYDMIMGMNFLRNLYTLMEFGNWVDGVADQMDPYMQFLSLTTPDQGRRDFIQTRLGGTDTTGGAQYQLLPQNQMQKSPVSEEEKKKKYQEMVLSRWPYILAGCLVGVLIIIGLIIWKCCRRRKNQNKRKDKGESAFFGGSAPGSRGRPDSYAQLQESSSMHLPLKEPSPAHRSSSHSPYQNDHSNGSFVGNPSQQHLSAGSYPPSPVNSSLHLPSSGYGYGYGKGAAAVDSPARYGSPGPPPYSPHSQ